MGGPEYVKLSHECPRDSLDTKSDATCSDFDDIRSVGPGTKRAEVITQHMTITDHAIIYIGVFILSCAFGLENLLRVTYQPHVVADFGKHSMLASVNLVRGVVAALTYPTVARLSENFGRWEMMIVSVVLHIIGTIICSTCTNIEGFLAGSAVYQIGSSAVLLLVEVIINDITPSKWRLSVLCMPVPPILVNTWIAGNVSEAANIWDRFHSPWRRAIDVWAPIIAGASIPLLVALWLPYRRIRRAGLLADHRSTLQNMNARQKAIAIFRYLDVLDNLALTLMFTTALVPLTTTGTKLEGWRVAKALTSIIIGLFCMFRWVRRERDHDRSLLRPGSMLTDRAIWAAFEVVWMFSFICALQGNYLYTVMRIAFAETVTSATRINSLCNLTSTLTGVLLGFVLHLVHRPKRFIVAGVSLIPVAFGILFHFRGGTDSTSHYAIIIAQILLGFSSSLFTRPALTAIQATTRHDNPIAATALFLAVSSMGSAFGSAVSGSIFAQTLTDAFFRDLPVIYRNGVMAELLLEKPFVSVGFPIGTELRDAVITCFRTAQGFLTLTGLGLCVPLICFGLCMKSQTSGDEKSLMHEEIVTAGDDEESRGLLKE